MKKYTLILLVLLLTWNARAQQPEKNILGVRAGFNVSKLAVSVEDMGISTGWRTGFHFAVSDQVLLTQRLPLYLETGVDFSSRGGKIALAQYGEVYRTTPRPFYLQVPLLFNYHFNIRNLLTIQPFAGIYGGVGLRGRMEFDDLGKEELFGDRGMLYRLDFGIRAGVGFVVKRIYLGISYDIGCMNQFRNGSFFSYESRTRAIEIHNDCLSVMIGYNF